MGLFSRKPKYEEQLSSLKKPLLGNEFLINQVNDLRDRLSALEDYLGVYPFPQQKKYQYKKRGESGLVGAAQGLASRD